MLSQLAPELNPISFKSCPPQAEFPTHDGGGESLIKLVIASFMYPLKIAPSEEVG